MEHSFELSRHRRRLFGTATEAYAQGRPGYPTQVFDLLRSSCGLGPGTTVLEIGPGTGQATGPLLASGAEVVAVELSSDMAHWLRADHRDPRLQVLVGPFEEVDLPTGRFDLVVAATSFHWVEPTVGLARCADLLKPGGHLALWWNYFGDPERGDPFHHAIQPLLTRWAPELVDGQSATGPATGGHPYALDREVRVAEIAATGRFGPVEHHLFPWTGSHSPTEIRQMFASFSPWLALDPSVREPLLDRLQALAEDRFGGRVERPYLTPVYLARRR